MNPSVSVILLTTRAVDDTVACLRSLKAVSYDNLSIIVADNGSTDGTERIIRVTFPEVEFIQLGRNAGFAAGNNVGIRRALEQGADYILLLNNDTLVEPGFLEPLVEALEGNPAAGCSTGTICFYPETDRLWYAGGDLVVWRGSGFNRHYNESSEGAEKGDTESVTFISGCLMLVRRSVFEKVGLLEEKTFLYCEDAEFSLRVRAAGYDLLYIPPARIFHKTEHRSQTPFSLYYIVRNRLLVADLRFAGPTRFAAKIYILGTTLLKVAVWSLRRSDLARSALMGIQDHWRGVYYEGRGLSFAYRSQ